MEQPNVDPKNKRRGFHPNYLVAVIIIGLALFFLLTASQIKDANSRIVPIVVSVFSILMSIYLMIKTYRGFDHHDHDFSRYKEVLVVLGLLVGYIIMIALVGYYISTFVFCFITMSYLQNKNMKVKLLTSILLPLLVYLIFELLFDIKIPHGMLFEKFF